MSRLLRSVIPLYASLGVVILVWWLGSSGWSWDAALATGLRETVYGVLLTGLAITSASGHLVFGEAIVGGLGLASNEASRLFQREIGLFTAMIATASFFVTEEGMMALGLAWGGFLVCAGLNHMRSPDHRVTAICDLVIGALLLAVSLP